MKLHLLSDSHIDAGGAPALPEIDADICVLAGDIGSLRMKRTYGRYIGEIKERFMTVLWVLGNHEYYGGCFNTTLKDAENFAEQHDLILMDTRLGTESVEINGVKFWGSTLWTDLRKGCPMAINAYRMRVNDVRTIKNFCSDTFLKIHNESVEKIDWNADVVITHHRPIMRKHSDFNISDDSYSFCCTTLEDRIYDSKIKHWLYGHTHDNDAVDVGGTNVVSNQVRASSNGKPYDPTFFVTV